MSYTKLEFSKSWTNPEDFPTFEDSEEQVRADMQLLFDECRDGVNRLAGEIRAENVPFRRGPGIDAVNVQNALEVLRDSIAEATLGEVPDYSIEARKLRDGAVTEPKLADHGVTAAKLADGAVGTAALARGAVHTENLADGAVTAEKLADGTITAEKLAGSVLERKADLDDDYKVLPEQRSSAIVNVGSARELTLTDAGKLLNVNAAGPVTLTIPINSAAPFPVGTEMEVFQAGPGAVTVAGAEEVSVLSADGDLSVPAQYARLRLKKMAVNTWAVENERTGRSTLADGAVLSGKLADGAVTTEKLADRAVTYGKTAGVQQQHTAVTASLPAEGWSKENTITVTANGVTEDNTVLVAPAPDSYKAYAEAGIYCSGQGDNSLSFTAEDKPNQELTVNVMILNLQGEDTPPGEDEDESDMAGGEEDDI